MKGPLLFSKHNLKVANYIFETFKDDSNFYGLTVNRTEVCLQGYYDAELIKKLKKRKFKEKVSVYGYLHLTKEIAGVKLEFVFTD